MNKSSHLQYAFYALSVLPIITILSVYATATTLKHTRRKRHRIVFRAADEIPEEIWREIFIHAYGKRLSPSRNTDIHSSCTCGCSNERGFDWPFDSVENGQVQINDGLGQSKFAYHKERLRFQESFRAKMQFAQVSRMHWNVALEFLYRNLCVYSVAAVTALALCVASRTSVTRNAMFLWTTELRVNLNEIPLLDIDRVADAISCIMYCCADLCSISITTHPSLGKEHVWVPRWKKIMQNIPQGVQRLELSCTTKRFDNPALRTFGSLDAHYTDAPPVDLRHLSFFRSESLLGGWLTGALTHLYITHLQVTPENGSFWEMQKPALILLHLGRETRLNETTMETVLTGCPSLRFLEYHYLKHWSIDTWKARYIPRFLERITVKTFTDAKKYESVLFHNLEPPHWDHFGTHLLRPLFAPLLAPLPNCKDRRYVSVLIILPGTKEGLIASDYLTPFLQRGPLTFGSTDDTFYIGCGAHNEDVKWIYEST